MSVSASAWVWANSQAKGTARLVLLALADQADDNGRCYPSVAYIARKCRIAVRTAHDALETLTVLGEVVREPRPGHSTVYRVVIDWSVDQPNTPADSAEVDVRETAHRPDGGCADSAEVDCLDNGDASGNRSADPAHRPNGGCAGDRTQNQNQNLTYVLTSPPVGGSKGETSRKRSDAAQRGTRIPDDWYPDDDLVSWTRTNAPTVGPADVEEFRNYWLAKAGRDSRKLRWDLTWKNRATELQSRRAGNAPGRVPGSRKPTMDDVIAENAVRYEEMRRAEEAAAARDVEQLTLGGTL